jgi:uroporphyrin-III C-methyltransferase
MNGKAYLVGAGPGDPELLTVKALRLLQTADVVLHDDLVAPEILHLIPSSTRVQNVGKRCGIKSLRQEEINFLLVTLAASGLNVVRLKSGDPLIFGRAGEEIAALRKSAIDYEVVPGITSALGAAAAAEIPLTHREISSTVVFTAGHRATGDGESDWRELASPASTLVIYMPGHDYSGTSQKLSSAGFAAETPCVIVSQATSTQQRVHITTISQLHQSPLLAAPTLLIVGDVVKYANRASAQEEVFLPADEREKVVSSILLSPKASQEELLT